MIYQFVANISSNTLLMVVQYFYIIHNPSENYFIGKQPATIKFND